MWDATILQVGQPTVANVIMLRQKDWIEYGGRENDDGCFNKDN